MRFPSSVSRVSSMEMLRLVPALTALFWVQAAPQSLLCTNDFVSNVSCVWNGSAVNPGADCVISGTKNTYVRGKHKPMIQSCKLKHHENSPPGCSLVFENQKFSGSEVMPNISVQCDGALLETVKDYWPRNHIKMQPPGAPNINSSADVTQISWSAGHVSHFLERSGIEFQLQIKHPWTEAMIFHSQVQEVTVDNLHLKGSCQAKVRVKPNRRKNSTWSDWGPATSWMMADSGKEEWWMQQNVLISVGLTLLLGLIAVVLLVIYRRCKNRGLLKKKLVPNPSDYFHTLHSVHGGNLKNWLNPLSVSESFFTAQRCDHISPVALCDDWSGVPSPSPSSGSSPSTLALFHCHGSPPEGGSAAAGAPDDSSSSSCFSNMGYFMSGSSGVSARTDPNPAYFSYQDDPRAPPAFTSASLATWLPYESLKREPHSPDSGFCFGKEDELELDIKEEDDLDHLSSRLLVLPLNLPARFCPPMAPPPSPPQPVSAAQTSPDIQQEDEPDAADDDADAAAGRPVSAAMCRASSMPVESCRTGYLTLKELQTTFRNKSI